MVKLYSILPIHDAKSKTGNNEIISLIMSVKFAHTEFKRVSLSLVEFYSRGSPLIFMLNNISIID